MFETFTNGAATTQTPTVEGLLQVMREIPPPPPRHFVDDRGNLVAWFGPSMLNGPTVYVARAEHATKIREHLGGRDVTLVVVGEEAAWEEWTRHMDGLYRSAAAAALLPPTIAEVLLPLTIAEVDSFEWPRRSRGEGEQVARENPKENASDG